MNPSRPRLHQPEVYGIRENKDESINHATTPPRRSKKEGGSWATAQSFETWQNLAGCNQANPTKEIIGEEEARKATTKHGFQRLQGLAEIQGLVRSNMNTRFPTPLLIAVVLLICAAAVACWPGDQEPEPLAAIEKLTNEVLVLKIANGEKDLVLLQQQYQAVTQQIGALRQEQAAHGSRVLEAHKAAKGSTVDWQAGIIQPPAPKPPAPPKPAKKDGPPAPVTPAP